jgi:plasmid maintenance system antidote protein VapI
MEKLALLTGPELAELLEQMARRVGEQMIREFSKPRPVAVTQIQAAEMLGVSPPTVNRLLRAGKLKLNGAGRISIEAVDALLKNDASRS